MYPVFLLASNCSPTRGVSCEADCYTRLIKLVDSHCMTIQILRTTAVEIGAFNRCHCSDVKACPPAQAQRYRSHDRSQRCDMLRSTSYTRNRRQPPSFYSPGVDQHMPHNNDTSAGSIHTSNNDIAVQLWRSLGNDCDNIFNVYIARSVCGITSATCRIRLHHRWSLLWFENNVIENLHSAQETTVVIHNSMKALSCRIL